jgi:hypothetical protein
MTGYGLLTPLKALLGVAVGPLGPWDAQVRWSNREGPASFNAVSTFRHY